MQGLHLFRNAICNLQIPIENVCIVDDRIKWPSWGIERGCKTIWIQKGKFEDELPTKETGQPTITVPSLKEVLDIV